MSDYLNVDYCVAPNSSWIKGVAYDQEEKTTYVKTINDNVYGYTDTEYGDFVALAYADSVGHVYQDFAVDFGPSVHYGDTDLYLRMASNPDADIPLTDWESELLGVIDEADKDVSATQNSVDPVAELTWQRREGLEFAIRVHAGKGSQAHEVILDAEIYQEYLNG